MAVKGLKYVGTNPIKGMALGSQEGHRLYLGETLVWDKGYSVVCHLANITTNAPSFVSVNGSLSATLTPTTGYRMLSVAVTMGGTDITSTAYDNSTKTISIASVTADIVITAVAYVTNGLTYHFDGIDKGSNSGRWTDLISSAYFTFNTHSSVNTDSVILDGSGLLSGSSEMSISADIGTIEICAEQPTIGGAVVFFSAGTTGLSALVTGAGMCFRGAVPNQYSFTKANKFIWSSTDELCYYNGTKYTSKSSNTWSNPNSVATLGGRGSGSAYYFTGKIHSIRIYNRKLTESEILNNQKADNVRFNMGISY